MPLCDADIELLEAHLDGELSVVDEAALRHRLLSDPDLSSELAAIRVDRSVRTRVFESFEPDAQTNKRLVTEVRKFVMRDTVRGDRMRVMRYIASAAACVMISFSAGWLGKARVVDENHKTDAPTAIAQNDSPSPIANQNVATQNIGGGYPVAITNSLGQVLAVQQFKTLNDAREFSNDVSRWQQQKQQQRQNPVTENVLYKDQF